MTEPATVDVRTTVSVDDAVLPYQIKPLGVRGRIVRLGPLLDDILGRHDYPAAVSAALAEVVALAAMLGSTLKFEGKFILQTSTSGPLDMAVADFASPNQVRGYARFDAAQMASLETQGNLDRHSVIGDGHMAMTIDQGTAMDRYQGIVSLAGGNLAAAAHDYFLQSEQIPTALKLASGPLIGRAGAASTWRAGAIMIQHLPDDGGTSPMAVQSGDLPEGTEEIVIEEDDRWVKARTLLDTAEDHELIDPTLSSERLLFRLFHEDGVTVYPELALQRYCSCSHQRLATVMRSMSAEERADLAVNGRIEATCEFCSTSYSFDPSEIEPRSN